MSEIIGDVSEKVKEFAELSKTIKITQEKLKILNTKKKELYKDVLPKLRLNNITRCNLQFGTLRLVKTKRKVTLNKVGINNKFVSFYNSRALQSDFINASPEQKANILYKYLYIDNIEFKEDTSISMIYSKEFKDQFKQLNLI